VAESEAQPEAFGSIPRAMWWSMATLTTVGYGDTYPVTVLGKFLASMVAILGISVVALPAGIIAANFSKQLENIKSDERK
jgi:voltage-gated potassium channel